MPKKKFRWIDFVKNVFEKMQQDNPDKTKKIKWIDATLVASVLLQTYRKRNKN